MKPEFFDNVNDVILMCPHCRDQYLHHSSVTVFERANEDDSYGLKVDINNMSVYADQNIGENPSLRRNGILISFNCEQCSEPMSFAIVQHKGCTYFEWLDQ